MKQVQRIGSSSKYAIWQAIDNAVKKLEIYWENVTLLDYAIKNGVVRVDIKDNDGWGDLTIFQLDKEVFVALPNMYYEENNFSLIGSDGNEYIWNFDNETITAA